MSGITDEQIHEVFTSFDVDGSGTLSRSELSNALNLLGIDLTDEELTDSYRIDDDPDTLSEEEFSRLIRDRIGELDCRQRCEECFREFDEEGTGVISRDMMKIILTQRGSHPMDDEDAEVLLDEFDINGDGQFNIAELVGMMYRLDSQADEDLAMS